MLRVNLIIRIKEFTLYIINNYCNTHLFTNALLNGHLQIWLTMSLSWSVGCDGPISFPPFLVCLLSCGAKSFGTTLC